MLDPLVSTFSHDIWHQVAENNTKIYRQVFRCMPDSEVLDWRTYEKFNEYNERFMQSQGLGSSKPRPSKEAPGKSGPVGSSGTDAASIASAANIVPETRPRSRSVLSNFVDKLRPGSRLSEDATHTEEAREKAAAELEQKAEESGAVPDSRASSGPTAAPSPKTAPVDEKEAHKLADQTAENENEKREDATPELPIHKPSTEPIDEKEGIQEEDMAFTRQRTVQYSDKVNEAPETTATQSAPQQGGLHHSGSQKRRRRGTTKSSARIVPEEVMGREEAEEMLKLVQGHLVLWPYEW